MHTELDLFSNPPDGEHRANRDCPTSNNDLGGMTEEALYLDVVYLSGGQSEPVGTPIESDREQVLRDVAEICKRERRMLRKENPTRYRTPTTAELHALPDFSNMWPVNRDLNEPARPILNSPTSNSTPTTPQPRFVRCDELLEDVLDWQDEDEKLNYELRYYYEHRDHSSD